MNHLRSLIGVFYSALFMMAGVLISGCTSDDVKSKSMSQIQSEEGIPVNVETISKTSFTRGLSFFGKLYGIKQTTRGALIGGKIEKVNASVGQFVKKDQVIIEFPKTAPSVGYEQALTAYEDSKKNYERVKALFEVGKTSQANLDGIEAKFAVDKRNYETQKQLIMVEAQFDGVITEVKVKEGDNVAAEAPLFTVAQTNIMRTKVWASLEEINQIRKGMTAYIKQNGSKFAGRVIDVALGVDPYTQSFYVELEFNNPKGELKPGSTVEVYISTYQNSQTLSIPRHIVMKDENGSFIFLENNGEAVRRNIVISGESGIDYEIKSGLNIGDRLIVKGSSQLSDGSKVKVIELGDK
ncbi:MAG: hypothetical protein CVV24_01345 [Ignavibacteriae bacterium HGW-Ignavibacteriae-3]|nr:MAG: hypothetical protein CVV24_01345 [Ignavibacteriae bacterium HGW-Ignavibacteriae-3]